MQDGMDWLFRPVLAKLCTLAELQNGTYNLLDVALMNEALDVHTENKARVAEWMRTHHGG